MKTRIYKKVEIVNIGISYFVGKRHFMRLQDAKDWISAGKDVSK